MKYLSILTTALVAASTFLPCSLAEEKPEYLCSTTMMPPPFNLGGYNVDSSLYEAEGNFSAGVVMVNHLWRTEFVVDGTTHVIKMWPFEYFNITYPIADIVHHLENDDKFAFDRTKPEGIFRGVGVKKPGEKGEREISNDEGIYVDFHGMKVKEAVVGVRALFKEATKPPKKRYFNETGIINLYSDGERLDADLEFGNINGEMEFEGDVENSEFTDGQEFFFFKSDMEFDAIGFITYSHETFDRPEKETHDYYLEYVDLCPMTKPVVTGDPHIETWSGMKFDFHGVCDLVLLQNPDFENGVGMDIHVRTEQLKQFSYVSSAVLRIGSDTLEVMGGNEESQYWVNQEPGDSSDEGIVGFLNGYPVVYQIMNSKQHEYTIKIGGGKSVVMTTFKKFVRVSIQGATAETFGSSLGLLGSYGAGKMVGRDGVTLFEEPNAFGQEWQVLPEEDMLFHSLEGPQAPEQCRIPVASSLRRRLGESKITEEEAQFACARVSPKDFDICVFDVMATDSMDAAGAY